jgi:hypothetical protein
MMIVKKKMMLKDVIECDASGGEGGDGTSSVISLGEATRMLMPFRARLASTSS